MPKPEILDPQGKAVTGALARLGFAGISVRQGKRFELDLEGELTEDRLAEVRQAAETLLANTVIETFNVRVEEPPSADVDQAEPLSPPSRPSSPARRADGSEDRCCHLSRLARRSGRAPRYPALRGEPVPLWHGNDTLDDVRAVILPGGFSYGDYLRCGAISRFAPVMTEVIKAADSGCRCSASATAFRSCARRTCCPVH